MDNFSGGPGQDTYILNWTPGSATDEIHDFDTSAGGDGWNIDALFGHFSGYDTADGTNPFIAQDSPGTHGPYLRLLASGTDTLLEISPNGDSTWFDIVKIDGVAPAALTNFGGYSPTGVGAILTGSSDGDIINGTSDADTISGNDGYDTVFGHNGDDSISGGNQNDQLFGQGGNDTISGDAGDDTISDFESANNLIFGDTTTPGDANPTHGWTVLGDDNISGNGTLVGGEGQDTITGNGVLYGDQTDPANVPGDPLVSFTDNDLMSGTGTMHGGAGDDRISGTGDLYGDAGNDTISGHGHLFGGNGNDSLSDPEGSTLSAAPATTPSTATRAEASMRTSTAAPATTSSISATIPPITPTASRPTIRPAATRCIAMWTAATSR